SGRCAVVTAAGPSTVVRSHWGGPAVRRMLLVVRWPAGLTQVTGIVSPGWNRARTAPSWSGEPMACPLIAVMTAPPVRPAWAAGPPQIVPSTRTPEETGAMTEGAASPALL